MVIRLDHVQLAMPAGGEDRARGFYVEALGFREEPKPRQLAERGGVWFRSEDAVVHIGVDVDFHPATKAHPAFCCAHYDDLIERLYALSVPVVSDDLPFEGKRHCYVFDPFGNRIELIDA